MQGVKLTGYADWILSEHERRSQIRHKLRVRHGKLTAFNCVITHDESNVIIRETRKIDKRTFKKYSIDVRNAFSGKIRAIEVRAMDYLHAVKQVAGACKLNDRILGTAEHERTQ